MLGEEDKPDRMTNDPLIKKDECFPSNLANPFVPRNSYSAHKIFTATVLLPPCQQNTKLSLYQEVIYNIFFLVHCVQAFSTDGIAKDFRCDIWTSNTPFMWKFWFGG